MIRRSKRLEEAPPKPSVEDGSDNDDTSGAMEPAEGEVPKKKKRKLNETKADPKSQGKKGKGKRGLLKDVVDMPMDVLLEILEYLEPLDLLNLSRTSKNLRGLLMSRSSIPLWKRVFKNVATPGLPECPPDLNEPRYADLVFNKSCTFCGRKLAIIHIAWHMRVKTCNTCLKEHFSEHVYTYSLDDIYELIPTIAVNQTGRYRHSKRYALRNTATSLLAEYQSLSKGKAQTAWLKKKSEEREVINAHAKAYATWAEAHLAELKAQRANVVDGRKAIVVDYLRELGWGEELDMIPAGTGPEDDQTIAKFCQKEVTPRGLQGMEEYFNEYMEGIKSRRITREQKEHLETKLATLKDIYTTYLNTLPPDVHYPKTADVFQEARVKEILYDPTSLVLSPEQIDRLHDIFPDILRSWADSIKQRVIESISKDASIVFDPTNVLELASTAFQCDRCSDPFSAREVIRHRCLSSHYQYDFYGTEHYELFKHISDFPWCGKWKLSKGITEKVAKVLESCSFDPATTTITDLEKADPIFECLACHELVRGRCMLRWFGLYQHCKSHMMPLKVIVVDKETTPKIRERMDEEHERNHARFRTFMCTHCRSTDNFVRALAHVKSSHQISKPIPGEDVIISPDASPHHEAFYFWPPRIQEDVEEMMKEMP